MTATQKHVVGSIGAWFMLGILIAIAKTPERGWLMSFALGAVGAVSLELYAWGRR